MTASASSGVEEFEGLVRQIADWGRSLLPPEDWAYTHLDYRALGSFESVSIENELKPFYEEPVPWGLCELLRDLRRVSYNPDKGAWAMIRLAIRQDGQSARLSYPDDDLYVGKWVSEITPGDCARELTEFPRPDSEVPGWMAERAALQRDADAFDPARVLDRPWSEAELAGDERPGYFDEVRAVLRDFMPDLVDRLLAGRLEEGHWSILRSGLAWLAVRFTDGRCDPVVAFGNGHSAIAHAAGRIAAEARMPVDAALLGAGQVLALDGESWAGTDPVGLGKAGRSIFELTRTSPRAVAPAAEKDSFIALAPLMNRPGTYFVRAPGPAPETGPYVGAGKVFELALRKALPGIAPSRFESGERVIAQRKPGPGSEVPRERRPEPRFVIPAGTLVDAYENNDPSYVYRVGTPFYRRGNFHRQKKMVYHLYRVERPLPASPSRFAAFPTMSEEEAAEQRRTDQGQGFYLGRRTIGDLLEDGTLSEVTGPDGAPAEPPEPVITQRRRARMSPQSPSGGPVVEQRPVPFDSDRYDELVQRLGRILVRIAPAGWRRVDLQVKLTAAVLEVALSVLGEDGGFAEVEPPRDFAEIAAELRSMMYRPDEGTWFGMRFTVDPPGEYLASFNADFDPDWNPPLPAEVWAHDLSVFPRTAEHIPRWLRDRLEDEDE